MLTADVDGIVSLAETSSTGRHWIAAREQSTWPDPDEFLRWARGWTSDHMPLEGHWRRGVWRSEGRRKGPAGGPHNDPVRLGPDEQDSVRPTNSDELGRTDVSPGHSRLAVRPTNGPVPIVSPVRPCSSGPIGGPDGRTGDGTTPENTELNRAEAP